MKKYLAFDAPASVRNIDDSGYLHIAVTPISKAAVNPYLGREIPHYEEHGLKAEGIYYGLRDAAELKKAAPTFNGLPLLMGHGDIDAGNAAQFEIIGSTGTDAAFDGTYLKNSLTIYDEKAIKAVEDDSAREISCAYFYEPDFTAGEIEIGGEKTAYNFIMRNIRGNHVALVKEGRAGHDVAVADSNINIKNRGGQKVSNWNKKQPPKATAAKPTAKDEDIIEVVKEALRAVLLEMKGGTAGDTDCTGRDDGPDFAEGVSYGEKLERNNEERDRLDREHESEGERKAAGDDEDALTERMDNDPAFREGFEMGVKYGERREKADPKRVDADHERDGEERYLSKDSLGEIKAKIAADVKANYKALSEAAAKVRPLVGQINDVMAYDSAAEVYKFALEESGHDVSSYPPEAYAGMVDVALRQRRAAFDAAPAGKTDGDEKKILDRLNAISK